MNDNNYMNNYIIAGGLSWTDEEIEEIYKDIDKQKGIKDDLQTNNK